MRLIIERDPLKGPSEFYRTKLFKKIADFKELINSINLIFLS